MFGDSPFDAASKRQAEIRAVKPQHGEDTADPAGRIHHEGCSRMRKLVALGVVCVAIAKRRSHRRDGGLLALEHDRRCRQRRAGADARRLRRAGGLEIILWIKADHDKLVIGAGCEPGLLEAGGDKREDRAAQGAAVVISEDDDGGLSCQYLGERARLRLFVQEPQSWRQSLAGSRFDCEVVKGGLWPATSLN